MLLFQLTLFDLQQNRMQNITVNLKKCLNSYKEIKEFLIKKENCRGKVSFVKHINSESSPAPPQI